MAENILAFSYCTSCMRDLLAPVGIPTYMVWVCISSSWPSVPPRFVQKNTWVKNKKRNFVKRSWHGSYFPFADPLWGGPTAIDGFHLKLPIMWSFDVYFVVSPKKGFAQRIELLVTSDVISPMWRHCSKSRRNCAKEILNLQETPQ